MKQLRGNAKVSAQPVNVDVVQWKKKKQIFENRFSTDLNNACNGWMKRTQKKKKSFPDFFIRFVKRVFLMMMKWEEWETKNLSANIVLFDLSKEILLML